MKINAQTEKRIDEMLKEMTLEEKVSLCRANSKFTVAGNERFGIDELTMSDGPHGVRSELERDSWRPLNREEDRCTYLPTGTALAATWNPELSISFGETLGSEARYRGKDVILGPGVNIIRTPLCGRNFEYFSEDPCLIEKMSPNVVKGIESQDTAACVKHYCLNNQELDRKNVNVEVSERALREIYLKGFYAAIIEGGASSVMGAYNRYKNQFCCHNNKLVNGVLKGEWGFKGVYLNDWTGTHDTDEAIHNGLDIEMGTNKPYNEFYLADPFLERAKKEQVVRDLLDEKVRRTLRLMFSINKFSADRKKGEFNTKEHQQVTYDIASEAMVLLKNEDNVLPLDKSKLKKLLVVGPNAEKEHSAGGSSSGVRSLYEITPLQGIKDRLGDICEIDYESGIFNLDYKTIPLQNLNIVDTDAGCRNYKVISYSDVKIIDEQICDTPDITSGKAESYDIIFSIDPPESGNYSFKMGANCDADIYINGVHTAKICRNPYHPNGIYDSITWGAALMREQNVDVKIHIEKTTVAEVNFNFGWITPSDYATSSKEELLQKAKEADFVIYCGGLDHSYDTESLDKKTMRLPSEQDAIIPEILDANTNTIIALTAGSPVEMPWITKAKAVLWTWYAGMEGGHVLADILTGDIVPSGKMPFTLPKVYADTPVARYGEYKAINVKYNEDILVGYRAFEYDKIKPLFPFGHGLSYSEFEYIDLKINVKDNGASVSFKIKNIGNVTAKEVTQLYIGDPVCSVLRPIKELRNFKKIELGPNETKEIELSVTDMDLSFYDEKTSSWKLEKGEFSVYVGSSSEDIRLKGNFIK